MSNTPTEPIRLSQTVSCAGCAAKLDPNMLVGVLDQVPWPQDPRVEVGFQTCDDAAVYRTDDDVQLVATTDFFTPIVDDPQVYGAAAAANALSDIYAMGGEPLYALSILHYPEHLGGELLAEIMTGAANICGEAGCPIVGGHSVRSDMMTFGLAVTGRIAAGQRAITNAGAKPGDALVLTKRLGTGMLATALKKGLLSDAVSDALVANLLRLNRDAGRLLQTHGAHAATDVTGFGLIGHAGELARGSSVRLEIDLAALPLLPWLAEAAEAKCITRGDASNRTYSADILTIADDADPVQVLACTDPQSSGGLLISLPAEGAEALVADLHAAGDTPATVIGQVVAGDAAVVLR